MHFNNSLVFKGGWTMGASFLLENFLTPPGLYDGYGIDLGADTVAFVGRPSITNYDFVVSFGTPQFPTFSASGFVVSWVGTRTSPSGRRAGSCGRTSAPPGV